MFFKGLLPEMFLKLLTSRNPSEAYFSLKLPAYRAGPLPGKEIEDS